jgi:hypothetical protein
MPDPTRSPHRFTTTVAVIARATSDTGAPIAHRSLAEQVR